MQKRVAHDYPTSNVLAWSSHAANVESVAEEESAPEADEPPDERPLALSPASKRFQKTTVRRAAECPSSLLTKAFQSHSEDDSYDGHQDLGSMPRRRSVNSNFSLASTADLTCDTGLTTPARTSSPSPRLLQVGFVPTVAGQQDVKPPLVVVAKPTAAKVGTPEKKRSISFACAAKPLPKSTDMPPPPKPAVGDAPKRSCIRFACAVQATTQQQVVAKPQGPPAQPRNSSLSPSSARKNRSVSAHSRSGRSVTPKRTSDATAVRFRNYLTADPKDLQDDSAQFHEFARDEIREEDWIRNDQAGQGRRLTIDDTLKMELAIRRLGKEVEEEEAEQEDEDEDAEADDADDVDDDADDGDEDQSEELDLEDGQSGYDSDDDHSSAGYHTDEELGFAESDDDEDDDLVLWTTAQSGSTAIPVESIQSMQRRASVSLGLSVGELSDSSAFSPAFVPQIHLRNRRHAARRPDTPELPDSTDFVCGTLDEDRPLEEAYMSCIAAKKKEKEKHHLIPQDIDPSFPTSEPEDDDDDHFKPLHRNSDDHVWLHGELEDLDHEGDRAERRKKKSDSPKRYHSPPPRRHHSPPQRTRGRSPPPPRRLFDRHSPVRPRSPAPQRAAVSSPQPSPVNPPPVGEQRVAFKALAFRPGLTHAKSLPRTPAVFGHGKASTHYHHRRGGKANNSDRGGQHLRGAIDIVKGLEQRRQRRKEKLKEKMCNRARKGLGHEKRPQPGKGAERMRELGLLMAGKIVPGKYVLSV